MFARDRRAKFPKLPAYETCNNAKSKLEHYLIAVLPFGGQYTDELVASLKWSRGTWHQGNCPTRPALNSRRQRGPDHPREIGAEVGFWQQQHAGVEPAMMHDGVFGIARRVKDLEPRASRVRLGRELAAVHAAGHDHVGEQQID